MKPAPKLTISQWADRYRKLSPEVSAESGQWETSRAEYQREMMDAITDERVEEVTLMKSVRTGGTQAVIDNAIGYFIHQDPGPMLMVHPGKSEGRDWSKDHFDTMVRDTPALSLRVSSNKIKDRKNEILRKQFPGGILYIIGSNSAAGFRQKTIQRVFLDDIDAYDVSAGEEGDQIQLARNRTISYTDFQRKIVKVSNPTIRGISKIEREYFKSDQRHYYVPCPECGHFQTLIFSPESQFGELATSFMRFDPENLSWLYYECENCHAKLEESKKLRMIRNGRWHKLKPEVINHAGFHLSELISPFSNWMEIVKSFLTAKRNREELRVFINQRLGETFVEEKSYEVDEDSLLAKRENYINVPAGVLVLTAGVDVQVDRLEAIIYGWGIRQECWFIDRRVMIGSPEREATWKELDEYLAHEWTHESGVILRPWAANGLQCVCIDSGYSAENVYRYVKRRQLRRYFAVKGDEGFKKPFIIDVKYDKKYHARFATIAVDAIKTRVYDRLNPDTKPGYGSMHFPMRCNEEFFNQLTSEKRVIKKMATGHPKLVWELKEGLRNEVLDCTAYNFAALALLNPDFEKIKKKFDDRVAAKDASDQTAAEEGAQPAVPVPEPRRRPPQRRRSKWVVK
jgi:phage terminase large subunit GpA-like protein